MTTLISSAFGIGIASTLIAAVCCTVVSRRGKFKEQPVTSPLDRVDENNL